MNDEHTASERGATAVEYALLVGLIAAVLITALTLLGSGTHGLFTQICNPPSPFSC